MNHLIIVDMQNDFVSGTLANSRTLKTIPVIVEAIKQAIHEGWKITYTVDTHYSNYLQTDEGKRLPVVHCVDGTWGHEIIPELKPSKDDTVLKKRSFAYDGWNRIVYPGDTVSICGTLSEICVVANAAAIRAVPDVRIRVLRDGCSSLTDEAQEAAMTIMAALHCDII